MSRPRQPRPTCDGTRGGAGDTTVPFKIPRTVSSTCVSSLEDRAATPPPVLAEGAESGKEQEAATSQAVSQDVYNRRSSSGRGVRQSKLGHEPISDCASSGARCNDSYSNLSPTRAALSRRGGAFYSSPSSSRIALLGDDQLIGLVVPLLRSFCVSSPDTDFPGASVFHGTCVPQISLEDYVKRIVKYGKISHATVVFALIYLDRILANSTDKAQLVVTDWTIHRTVLGCIVLAAKFLDDEHFNNHHMAAVGGVTNLELNALEIDMAKRLHFSFHVTSEQYLNYEDVLVPIVL